jgi:SOS response regulatory protein OraA/RecX
MVNRPQTSAPMKSARPRAGSDGNGVDALRAALRFLARGDRSTNQVTAFLSSRGYTPHVIRSTCRSLERLGYLNDEVTALHLAEAQLRRRPMGRSALRGVLATRQFPDGIADRAVRRAYENTTEQAVALRFLDTLSVKFPDRVRETRRRAALLAARGFPDDVIEPLLISALADRDIF